MKLNVNFHYLTIIFYYLTKILSIWVISRVFQITFAGNLRTEKFVRKSGGILS